MKKQTYYVQVSTDERLPDKHGEFRVILRGGLELKMAGSYFNPRWMDENILQWKADHSFWFEEKEGYLFPEEVDLFRFAAELKNCSEGGELTYEDVVTHLEEIKV